MKFLICALSAQTLQLALLQAQNKQPRRSIAALITCNVPKADVAQALFSSLHRLLSQAACSSDQLTAIGFSTGPAAFTSLRSTLSLAQTFVFLYPQLKAYACSAFMPWALNACHALPAAPSSFTSPKQLSVWLPGIRNRYYVQTFRLNPTPQGLLSAAAATLPACTPPIETLPAWLPQAQPHAEEIDADEVFSTAQNTQQFLDRQSQQPAPKDELYFTAPPSLNNKLKAIIKTLHTQNKPVMLLPTSSAPNNSPQPLSTLISAFYHDYHHNCFKLQSSLTALRPLYLRAATNAVPAPAVATG